MWLPILSLTLGSIHLWEERGGTALDFIPGATASEERWVGHERPAAPSRSDSRMPHPQGRGAGCRGEGRRMVFRVEGTERGGIRPQSSVICGLQVSLCTVQSRGPQGKAWPAFFEGERSGTSPLYLSCPLVVCLMSDGRGLARCWALSTFFALL